jgi:hypothetical protein
MKRLKPILAAAALTLPLNAAALTLFQDDLLPPFQDNPLMLQKKKPDYNMLTLALSQVFQQSCGQIYTTMDIRICQESLRQMTYGVVSLVKEATMDQAILDAAKKAEELHRQTPQSKEIRQQEKNALKEAETLLEIGRYWKSEVCGLDSSLIGAMPMVEFSGKVHRCLDVTVNIAREYKMKEFDAVMDLSGTLKSFARDAVRQAPGRTKDMT